MEKAYAINPNPDFLFRKEIEKKIKENNGYCIMASHQDEDTLCMCKEFKEQEYSGWCKCKQYYKVLRTPKVCLCGSSRFKE